MDGGAAWAAGWIVLAGLLRARSWRIDLFWNGSGACYTARLVDRVGRLMPPEDEGEILVGAAATPTDALLALAREAAS